MYIYMYNIIIQYTYIRTTKYSQALKSVQIKNGMPYCENQHEACLSVVMIACLLLLLVCLLLQWFFNVYM